MVLAMAMSGQGISMPPITLFECVSAMERNVLLVERVPPRICCNDSVIYRNTICLRRDGAHNNQLVGDSEQGGLVQKIHERKICATDRDTCKRGSVIKFK